MDDVKVSLLEVVTLVEAVGVSALPPLLIWLPRMLIATELFVYQFEPWL